MRISKLNSNINVTAGAKYSFREVFSIYRRNLNIIPAHDYAKIFFLKVDISGPKFDIILLSETYLDSSIQNGNKKL